MPQIGPVEITRDVRTIKGDLIVSFERADEYLDLVVRHYSRDIFFNAIRRWNEAAAALRDADLWWEACAVYNARHNPLPGHLSLTVQQ